MHKKENMETRCSKNVFMFCDCCELRMWYWVECLLLAALVGIQVLIDKGAQSFQLSVVVLMIVKADKKEGWRENMWEGKEAR